MSASETDTSSKPYSVKPPFDDPSFADIAIRSCDGVDFYAFKSVLAITSPVFRDMLSIPTPASLGFEHVDPNVNDVSDTGLPIVTMHESPAPVVDALLRVLYPVEPPIIDDFAILSGLIQAAKKYEMSRASKFVEQSIHSLVRGCRGAEMAHVFHVAACQYDMTEVARATAIESLRYPFDITIPSSLASPGLSATQLWRLFAYRKRVEKKIASTLFTEDICEDDSPFYHTISVILDGCSDNCSNDTEGDGNSWIWLKWRSIILRDLCTAPLSPELISKDVLLDVINRSPCSSCKNRIKPRAGEIVRVFKIEMLKIAMEVCDMASMTFT